MSHWTGLGVVAGTALGLVILGINEALEPPPRRPEASSDGLRDDGSRVLPLGSIPGSIPGSVPVDVRARTAGIRCAVTSEVSELPEELQVRLPGQLRVLPVQRVAWSRGLAVGEIVIPYSVLDDVDWNFGALVLTGPSGASAAVSEESADGACVASLGVAPLSTPLDISCKAAGGLSFPAVVDARVWGEGRLPRSWPVPTVTSNGDALRVQSVAATGTADVVFDGGRSVRVWWRDGVCAEVPSRVDTQLCIDVSGGDALLAEDPFVVHVEGARATRKSNGLYCAQVDRDEVVVSSGWVTPSGLVERDTTVDIDGAAFQVTAIRGVPYPTTAGVWVWPSSDGPRVVAVAGVADVSGIQRGDVLVSVGGEATEGRALPDALAALDAGVGAVPLTVERNDRLIDLVVMFDEGEGDSGQ